MTLAFERLPSLAFGALSASLAFALARFGALFHSHATTSETMAFHPPTAHNGHASTAKQSWLVHGCQVRTHVGHIAPLVHIAWAVRAVWIEVHSHSLDF